MEKLAMCRICMSEDVRMYYLVNTNLQETYEKLVDMPFEMKGARPLQVCYMCYARLQNCHQLRVSCLQSEELFHQMLKNTGFELTVLHDMNRLQVVHPPLVQLSIVPEASCHSDGDVDTRNGHMMEQFRVIPDMQDYNEDAPVPIKQEQTKLKDEFDTEIKFKPNKSFLKRLQTIYQTNIEKKKYKSNGADIKKCEICDKRFSRYSKLLRHLRKHTDDKPYKCQICEKSYKHKTHLLCHIRIHTDEKVVKSGEKCINQVDIVSKYNFVHNDEKHYKCDICGKLFFTKATLSSHLRTHTGIKPHKCNMCDKAFGIKATLIKHIRLHTGEKPFQCKLCGTCFRQQITLTKHMRLHTGEKPYKCNVCQKCFTEKGNLTRHFLIHTGEKPYKCEICKKSFNQKVTLSKHYYTH